MNTGLWNMGSGFAAARRPGMTIFMQGSGLRRECSIQTPAFAAISNPSGSETKADVTTTAKTRSLQVHFFQSAAQSRIDPTPAATAPRFAGQTAAKVLNPG